jgi:hypothetical protein
MKNKPFFIVETGLEKLLKAKKEMKKAKEMQEEVDEYMIKKQLEEMPMPKLKFGRKR